MTLQLYDCAHMSSSTHHHATPLLFEQEEACHRGSVLWWQTIAPALNFTHKIACAALFGFLGLETRSWEQLGALVALQVRLAEPKQPPSLLPENREGAHMEALRLTQLTLEHPSLPCTGFHAFLPGCCMALYAMAAAAA
jgi:hypothetical protein